MSNWPSAKAKRVLTALERIGWHEERQRGSHRVLDVWKVDHGPLLHVPAHLEPLEPR